MFRYKKSIPVDYDLQGYIYFASRRFRDLPEGKRKKIRNLCEDVGGEYSEALFEFVTTDAGATAICTKYYISLSTLERAVKRYYVAFARVIGRI